MSLNRHLTTYEQALHWAAVDGKNLETIKELLDRGHSPLYIIYIYTICVYVCIYIYTHTNMCVCVCVCCVCVLCVCVCIIYM